jgi:hypothetical protein
MGLGIASAFGYPGIQVQTGFLMLQNENKLFF